MISFGVKGTVSRSERWDFVGMPHTKLEKVHELFQVCVK